MSFDVYAHCKDHGMAPLADKPQYVKAVSEFVCPRKCGFTEFSSRYIHFGYWSDACQRHFEEECPLKDVVGLPSTTVNP